jgi:hypothetical protein
MATKRADVHGTINVTSASEVFTQDLEDLPEGMDLGDNPKSTKPAVSPADISAGAAPVKPKEEGMPTEAERSSLKLISEAQGKRFFILCREAKVRPEDVCAFCEIQNIFWMSWDSKNPKNSKKIELALQKQPEIFAQKEVKQPAPAKVPEAPAVMGQEDFEKEVFGLLLGAQMSDAELDSMLDVEHDIKGGIKNVPANRQAEILNALLDKAEAMDQAGA